MQAAAAVIALWGTLTSGPHTVGFRSGIILDPIRQYDIDRKPRPVLNAMWYPAAASSGESMQFGDYLDIKSPNSALAIFTTRLARFTRNTVIEDLYQIPAPALHEEEKRNFDRLLKTTVYARKNATPLSGKFPLLLYSHGAGGTYEENSVLFEYLASRGYVVISTAFQCPDASYMTDCSDSTRLLDLEFLLRHATSLPFVDPTRVALIGHSHGGQSSIRWGFRNGFVSAVVSLDSTIEQKGLDEKEFDSLRQDMEANDRYTTPTLLFAPLRHVMRGGKAVAGQTVPPKFETLDERMKFAPRYEVTVDGLAHDEYLSDGVLTDAFLKSSERRRIYEHVCAFTLRFLDVQLRGMTDSLASSGDAAITVKFKPPKPLSPSALEILAMYDRDGPEKTRLYVQGFGDNFEEEALYAAARILLEQGRIQEAARISRWALTYWQADPRAHMLEGELLAASGDKAGARVSFERALEIIDNLKELSDEEKAYLRALVQKTMKVLR